MDNCVDLYVESFNHQLDEEIIEKTADSINRALNFLVPEHIFLVSLTLTNDNNIQQLNNEYRSLNKPTDVLSFPQYNFLLPLNPEIPLEYDGDYIILGDIMISIDTAARQSIEFNHSMLRELSFLSVHSILHLLGYDHINDNDRVLMEEKQTKIMDYLKILR